MDYKNKANKKGAPEGANDISFSTLKISLAFNSVNAIQPSLFSDAQEGHETPAKRDSQPGTNKELVLAWLRERWMNNCNCFSKKQAASALNLTPSKFARALWSLREDLLVSYYYRNRHHDYLVTRIAGRNA